MSETTLENWCRQTLLKTRVDNVNRMWPNKITGANAGGPRQFTIRAHWAARVGEFCRSAEEKGYCSQ